jgi:hypothetical protein
MSDTTTAMTHQHTKARRAGLPRRWSVTATATGAVLAGTILGAALAGMGIGYAIDQSDRVQ